MHWWDPANTSSDVAPCCLSERLGANCKELRYQNQNAAACNPACMDAAMEFRSHRCFAHLTQSQQLRPRRVPHVRRVLEHQLELGRVALLGGRRAVDLAEVAPVRLRLAADALMRLGWIQC